MAAKGTIVELNAEAITHYRGGAERETIGPTRVIFFFHIDFPEEGERVGRVTYELYNVDLTKELSDLEGLRLFINKYRPIERTTTVDHLWFAPIRQDYLLYKAGEGTHS